MKIGCINIVIKIICFSSLFSCQKNGNIEEASQFNVFFIDKKIDTTLYKPINDLKSNKFFIAENYDDLSLKYLNRIITDIDKKEIIIEIINNKTKKRKYIKLDYNGNIKSSNYAMLNDSLYYNNYDNKNLIIQNNSSTDSLFVLDNYFVKTITKRKIAPFTFDINSQISSTQVYNGTRFLTIDKKFKIKLNGKFSEYAISFPAIGCDYITNSKINVGFFRDLDSPNVLYIVKK